MNENNNNKYEVIAKYIKDVSFEIQRQKLSWMQLKILEPILQK